MRGREKDGLGAGENERSRVSLEEEETRHGGCVGDVKRGMGGLLIYGRGGLGGLWGRGEGGRAGHLRR